MGKGNQKIVNSNVEKKQKIGKSGKLIKELINH